MRRSGALPAALCVVAALVLSADTIRAEAPPPATPNHFGEFGWIATDLRQVRAPNGQMLIVRGTLHNPYDEPVEGVRLVLRLLTAGEAPRELDRIERDLDVSIPPGGKVALNREVMSGYAYVFNSIAVAAFAKRRGAVDLPPPSRDIEKLASESREVLLFNATVPIINCPIVTPIFNFNF